ncbi:DUF1566 domain-containing protein [Candidatus Binatia bacterium]|nr:DUF1566 domain-containing protein [Candidatus Binatia bacterium]
MRHAGLHIVTVGVFLAAAPAAGALTPEQKCQAGKNQVAGKYADCRQKAEAKLVKTGDVTKYAAAIGKCETKFQDKWQKLIDAATAASATCPDAPLAVSAYKDVIDDHTDNIAQALGGSGFDVCQAFPESGQTTCWDSSGTVVTCAGTAHDGDVRAGAALAYTDNGDGTITDMNTRLMWAKKSDDGSIHDKDTNYTWDNAYATYVAALNAPPCFAGHCDWRLPNIRELLSIVNYGIPPPGPVVDPVFNTSCTGGCTVTGCSCTVLYTYWSSTTYAPSPQFAWTVSFDNGTVGPISKPSNYRVRAVRGGV